MIKLSKASIKEQECRAVEKVLLNEYLGMGNEVQLFEKELADHIGCAVENVICVNTGTSALHLALSSLDIGPGDEVLVPSLTYVASYQAISSTGAIPVSCDINDKTLFIDIEDAKSKITKKSKAIMPVHYASSAIGLSQVYSLAKEFDLRVVEDAAQGFGCYSEDGKKVGQNGDVICFSFDGIKNITCGEGGAIITADTRLQTRLRDGRLLGVQKDTEARYAGKRSWDFDVFYQGYRYHMSNINAAIGREQLKKINDFAQCRREIVKFYIAGLSGIDEISIFNFDYEKIIPHIFVVSAKRRDMLRSFLLEKGIETGLHYKPNHLLTKYRIDSSLPAVEAIFNEILTLPCHVDLSEGDLSYVIESIRDFYEK